MNEFRQSGLEKTNDFRWPIAAALGLSEADWERHCAHANELGANPFDLALGEGLVSETQFLVALSGLLGVIFTPAPPPPKTGIAVAEAWAFRSYRVEGLHRGFIRVIAPSGSQAEFMMSQHAEGKLPPLVLTTRQALLDALVANAAPAIADNAAFTLPATYSARRLESDGPSKKNRLWSKLSLLAIMSLFVILAAAFPLVMATLLPLLLAPIFILAGIGVLTASLISRKPTKRPPALAARQLPRYSVLVPLYHEGNVVKQLIRNMRALDYPRDRIELFLLVEEGDNETRDALRAEALDAWMKVLVVPEGNPRTKPRALNTALPFCTGDLLVVYDAEDAPDPDQLLRAAELFGANTVDTACAQARLAISNARDNFITMRFALDYAALFDCVKAGSAHSGWAVPLGGSSNHFRVSVLRQIGGWDAWNVTEDADLGIRLARLGWHVEDLPSTTWEEAPNTIGAWMNQRTRWMKGWLQTISVHARAPKQMLVQLGLFRTLLIVTTGFSVLLGSLLYPAFTLGAVLRAFDPLPLGSGPTLLILADSVLILSVIIASLVEIIPALIALKYRRALFLLPWVFVAPIWYFMMSFAAWRALLELARQPYHWHKTAHGQARKLGGLAGAALDRAPRKM